MVDSISKRIQRSAPNQPEIFTQNNHRRSLQNNRTTEFLCDHADMQSQDALFHIVGSEDWAAAQQAGRYNGGIDKDGFIHLSDRDQVLTPANIWYVGRTDLLLLVIDETLLSSELRREPGTGTNELFPHLYGELNLDAVVAAVDFPPDDDGSFSCLPAGL